MSMWEEYQAAAQAAKTASRQAGRIGATDVDRHRAYAAKQEMLRLEGEYRKSAQLNAVIPAEIQQQLADRLLATIRQELKDLLPHPLRGLTENFTDGEAPLAAMLDAQGQAYWGPGDGGDSEGDYAFKLSATENMDGNGDPYDPPQFTVNVLGGTAQTLGGTPYVYDDEELSNVEEGWHIYVVYENLEPAPSFTEYGEWRPGIKASSKTDMADYTAPRDLVFEIGRISKEYSGNVRQGHKGNIVMPAISNVVDIQTQLP